MSEAEKQRWIKSLKARGITHFMTCEVLVDPVSGHETRRNEVVHRPIEEYFANPKRETRNS